MRLRGSICSRYVGLYKQETNGSRFRSNSEVPIPEDMEHTVDHPAEPRATTAVLPPVMVIIYNITILFDQELNFSTV